MNKANILQLAFILTLLPIAHAETQTYATSANITFSNDSVRIQSEHLDITYNTTPTAVTTNHIINITREINITTINNTVIGCDAATINNITTTNLHLSEALKDYDSYFSLYVSCFGNLTTTQTKLTTCQDKPDFKGQYESCTTDLNAVTLQKQNSDLVKQQKTEEANIWLDRYNATETQVRNLLLTNKDLSNQRWIFLLVGGAATFGGIRLYKERKNAAKNPAEELEGVL